MKRKRFSTHFAQKITSIIVTSLVILGSGVDTIDAFAPDINESADLMDPVLTPESDPEIEELKKVSRQLSTDVSELTCLYRVIGSESHVESEQRIIAWVVRNRVEKGIYGKGYCGVAYAKLQFSGLTHRGDPNYAKNNGAQLGNPYDASWVSAERIAREVYNASPSNRPIGKDVTHFYSPNLVNPGWAEHFEHEFSSTVDGVTRFRFYSS